MNARTKTKALSTLDGMREIVQREMLTRGVYLTDVHDSDLAEAGAICGGRRACLIGSAWVAYGVKPDDYDSLPGTDEDDREAFLRNRPALKVVYDTLNQVAERRFARHPQWRRPDFASAAEALFEGNYGKRIDRADILRLVASARREIVKS